MHVTVKAHLRLNSRLAASYFQSFLLLTPDRTVKLRCAGRTGSIRLLEMWLSTDPDYKPRVLPELRLLEVIRL